MTNDETDPIQPPEPDPKPVPTSVPLPKGHFERFTFSNTSTRDVHDLTYELYDPALALCPPSPNVPTVVPQGQLFDDPADQPKEAVRIVIQGQVPGDPQPQFRCDHTIQDPGSWRIRSVEADLREQPGGISKPHATLTLQHVVDGSLTQETVPHWDRS